MLRKVLFIAAALAGAPAMADGPSYNFLTAGFQEVDFDDDVLSEIDGDGWTAGGSVEISDNLHVFAGYGSAEFDFDVELTEWAVGIGLHTPISNTTDFVAEIAYVEAEAEALGLGFEEDGYGASIGLRSMLTEQLELAGSFNYVDFGDDAGDDTSLDAAMWYSLTPQFALGISAGFDDDVTTYGAGFRLYFGD